MDYNKLNIKYPIEINAEFFFCPSNVSGADCKKISSLPLYILIGLTCTGKSTLILNLTKDSQHFKVMPNRRDITSKCIIEPLQFFLGKPVGDLQRIDRYSYVGKFREYYYGGMAYVLDNIYLKNINPSCLIFDGLRGENEVKYAVEKFPKAHFIALITSDFNRLIRLIFRDDPHDRTNKPYYQVPLKKIKKLSDIDQLFSILDFSDDEKNEIIKLLEATQNAFYKISNLLKILAKDKQLNNPDSSIAFLKKYAFEKSYIYDNSHSEATAIAEKVITDVFINK